MKSIDMAGTLIETYIQDDFMGGGVTVGKIRMKLIDASTLIETQTVEFYMAKEILESFIDQLINLKDNI
jgi:hypothetical protein